MARILITHGIPAEGFSALHQHELILPAPLCAFSEEELMQHIVSADAVVAGGKLPGHVIAAAKKLKIIANYGAGYDGVDIRAAFERGIPVTNIPDTVTQSTSELALALMLSVSRRVGELNLRLRKEVPETLFGMGLNMGRCLHGQALGIIGCGRIGAQVARLAKAFGMRVLGYDPVHVDEALFTPCSFAEILQQADIVSLHCPLTEKTRALIDANAFAQMKPGAILINTARGGVVDYDALTQALCENHLAGAGLDVYPDEPHIPSALLRDERVVCTPHIGANTEQTRYAMAEACAKQILDALSGKRPENIVNGL